MKPRLIDRLRSYFQDHRSDAHRLLHSLVALDRQFLLRSAITDAYASQADDDAGMPDSPLAEAVALCQEAAVNHAWLYLALRHNVARWQYLRVHLETMDIEPVDAAAYLHFKERLATGADEDAWTLEFDVAPFSREMPKLQEADSIGNGVRFLNRRLSSRLFETLEGGALRMLDFLRLHRCQERQLMLSSDVGDLDSLRTALRQADHLLGRLPGAALWEQFAPRLRALGFEPGWGNDAGRVRETMAMLRDLLEAPSPAIMESFLARIPMIFSVAVLSPHGWFGQSNVLGRPDTGGQVVYILDQVRALEADMRRRLAEQGLDAIEPQVVVITRLIPEAEGTTCDQRVEAIAGSSHARILRVPFRNAAGEVLPNWLSRFEVWPYLERFAVDAERDLLAELHGRPDLIIGNYSDGNLVATLMAQHLGVTQCNIAHALEKTKYLYSDLYWRDMDAHYHFGCQFTADLIAMNAADFIITSTYQEIAGTADSLGQYESYMTFTLPGLYRVVNGTDIYDPKFNIVSPGADPDIYFPYERSERRLGHLHPGIEAMVFGAETGADARGVLVEPDKPLLFTMARMDRIKNITGLVEWYGSHAELRARVNLLVVAGHVDPAASGDDEEREQILHLHHLMDHFGLDGEVRWLGRHLDKATAGELYRFVADRRGAFVQPALFEAFGLTVIEAMASGLPTFATCFGGPLEIIEDGVSGFHVDPNHGDEAAAKLAAFFARCREEEGYWQAISAGGLARVEARYTWQRYAERMLTLARVYGFWKYVSDLERTETRRYLEMFYGLQFRPLALALGH
ncbi:sucrose synthase [Parasulfuritortus cantonensis]|uniref:Sucrose synthase n=1 Tax=Parasulfuritortus cantonensis TaxID=2528202 RepID=A0A4R1BLZ3_9PROT|nr:sucrose synthase [Parasulfuritortus cantonensis]TCJ18490.1 sucrose synthase [Parasulfuritortus cantonensis]